VTSTWRRALRARTIAELGETNRSARARLELAQLLRRAGYDVGIVRIHAWSRREQGLAYLWAVERLAGAQEPAPEWVRRAPGSCPDRFKIGVRSAQILKGTFAG
jgi:hypothetical protein